MLSSKKILYVLFLELCLFWVLLLAGIGIDKLMNKYFPSKSKKDNNIAYVNIQIILITLVSVIGRPFVIEQLGGVPELQGTGILYAFALLLGQDSFKERLANIL